MGCTGEPEEDDPMIRAAKEKAKAKKERKEAALSAKTKAKAARQHHPEIKIEVGGPKLLIADQHFE